MKNVLVKLLALVSILGISLSANAQNVNIPDASFKNALVTHSPTIDLNGDGEIQVSEAEAFIGLLDISNKGISDPTGLEAFINITKLWCQGNSLISPDFSANTKLTTLYAYNNPIGTIDLSNNALLDTLFIFSSQLTSIDLSSNTALIYVHVSNNQLTSIDVTNNTALENIVIQSNNISTFTFPAALTSTLKGISYGYNPMASTFDFTQFPNLEILGCPGAGLTSLDVSSLSNLKTLSYFDNPITSLDLSQNASLETIQGPNTHIKDLDLSNNPNLTLVFFSANNAFETEDRLETINLANGNNGVIDAIYLGNNPSLVCVQVDDPADPFPNASTQLLNGFSNFRDICVPGQILFVDPTFETALLEHNPTVDLNADGILTQTEAAAFTGILDLGQRPIKNVQEIKYFTGITGLDVAQTDIGNLDLSQNSALTTLDISGISELRILSLDNGNNEAITNIATASFFPQCITVDDPTYAENNWTFLPSGIGFSTDCSAPIGNLTFENRLIADGYDLNTDGDISVSEAEQITELKYTSYTNLFIISGFEGMTALHTLELPVTFNTSAINLTQNTQLSTLKMPGSSLASLDLSMNRALSTLDLNGSENTNFKTLDLSGNPALSTLNLYNSNFEELDISSNTGLRFLNLYNNNLTELDLSHATSLLTLRVQNNNLNTVNIKNGNNEGISALSVDFRNNPDLTCITVDDVAYAETNFTNIDAGTGFDIDCDDAPIQFADANLEAALLAYSPAIDLNADGDIRLSEAAAFTGVLNLSGLSIATADELKYFTGTTGLDISNNNLTLLNIRNGNNKNFTVFDATGNSGLGCIKVDQAKYSEENWTNIDAGTSFSAYCDTDEEVYIPDEDLRTALFNHLLADTNGDGEITYGEALAFTGNLDLDILNIRIADMTGIEAFENITGFECGRDNTMSELDLSPFDDITTLRVIQGNSTSLTSLDISHNLLLETINIARVPVINLDLSNYTNLTSLNCNTCELSSVDLSQNTQLATLFLYNNLFTSIDLSNNTLLTRLDLVGNPINALDVSMLVDITDLYLSGNFTSLDVSTLTKLKNIEVISAQFQTIDLSNNLLLEDVRFYGEEDEEGNQIQSELTEITFGENTLITYMELNSNKLTSLDISFMDFEEYRYVDASNNLLEELNIGKISSMYLVDNPNLTCAKTTDVAYAEANYDSDPGLSFDPNCFKTGNDILTFSIPEQVDDAVIVTGEHSVYVLVPAGTDVTALVPTFTISDAAMASPVSGMAQDFSSTFVYTITAEDGTPQDWDVDVDEEVSAPTDISISSSTVNENSAPGTVVGNLTGTDTNFIESFTFSVVDEFDNSDDDYFEVIGNNLVTTDFGDLDFETESSFFFYILVEDHDGETFEKEFNITLSDVNEIASAIDLSNGSVDESNPAGTVVGTLTTTDQDAGDTHTYSFASGNSDHDFFKFNGDQLVTSQVLDFETKSSFSLNIITTDAGGLSFEEESFTITVKDLPASITSLDLSNEVINENESAGTTIGAFSTTGEDLSGSYTYTLVSGDGDDNNASFDLSNDQLLALVSFDFESKSSYSIRVRTDDGTLTRDEIFTISVENVFEAPTDLALSENSIAENNAINEVIGTLLTTDEDAGESFTYTLVSGDGDTDNDAFNINGDELRATDVFDFETKDTYSVRIETNDGNGGTYQEAFTVNITNENENISVVNPISDESREVGFGSFDIDLSGVFSDEDGDALTYSAISSDATVVTVASSGSTLTVSEVGIGTATISVMADDGSGVTTSDVFEVEVTAAPLGLEDAVILEIYPNPTSDFVNIKSDRLVDIGLFDLRGQRIQTTKGQSVQMNLQKLSSGSYILKITDGESTVTRRIIKAN